MSEGAARWVLACHAVERLSQNPADLKGMIIRARVGQVRDALLDRLDTLTLPVRKIHPNIPDEMLFGGVDLAATLSAGQVIHAKGIINEPCVILLTMGERCPHDLTAKLGQILDADKGHCLIVLDEGACEDEACPAPLVERLAFSVDLDGIERTETITPDDDHSNDDDISYADALAALTCLAARFGIDSLRAPWLALKTAEANGEDTLSSRDLELAGQLVFAHRATQIPTDDASEHLLPPGETPPNNQDNEGDEDTSAQDMTLPEEMLIAAVQALLPDGLLDAVQNKGKATTGSGGAGTRKKGNRRGRPLPSRPGRLDGRNRIDLVATLRAAAPWQTIRARSRPDWAGLHIRPSDIRVKRFEERSDRLLIFTVDASGSSAMARLGEAKGAVELLLAEAYARRDHVALVAFRGTDAELLLPPTRSLVQTKRRLAALPGGGGTPLAAGLRTAMDIGRLARGKGLSPTVALLTDGRANIALDGEANRAQAGEDAEMIGRCIRAEALPAILVDTGNRPTPALRNLAGVMDAPYVALPRADAQRISSAVSDAMD